MKQRPVVFNTVFEVTVADKEQTLHTIGGEQIVHVGDYIFKRPDGCVSRVKRESISQFEEVETING
jgi:hypothetical protein